MAGEGFARRNGIGRLVDQHSFRTSKGGVMNDPVEAFARICTRLESLERRVAALERIPQPTLPLPATLPRDQGPATEYALPQPTGVFPVVGKAMLGFAGAYVLRAVAESGAVPKVAIVVLALAYGGTWLVWASRVRSATRFASTIYAATASLILAPMLGELTLRFRILPTRVTAALLGAYVLAATFLAWKRNLLTVVWVGMVTGVCSALALLILSRNFVPYVTVLLVVAAVSEFAATRRRWLSLRAFAAPAVDLAVANLLYTFSLPENSRVEYEPVTKAVLLALPSLLFFIYGASIVFRTLSLRENVTAFEMIQAVISFVLAGVGWLWSGTAGTTTFGVCCWLLALACYAAAFVCFSRTELRNYRVYAAWSAALLLAGSFLILSPSRAALLLGVLAVVSTVVGVRIQRLMPGYQAFAYLAAAAFASGLLRYVGLSMTGTLPSTPVWTVWIVAVCAIFCYAFGGRLDSKRWNQELLRFLLALLAVSAVAAFLVSAVVGVVAAGFALGPSHVAVVRTLVVCTLALALAYSGGRWQRTELLWTAYFALAFVTAKLEFEDLRYGGSGSIAISLFLYALALIIVPRLGRTARQKPGFRDC